MKSFFPTAKLSYPLNCDMEKILYPKNPSQFYHRVRGPIIPLRECYRPIPLRHAGKILLTELNIKKFNTIEP